MEIRVSKLGRGVHVMSGYRETREPSMENFRSRFKVELINKCAITFGTSETPSTNVPSPAYITAPWSETAKKCDRR
jgi:hypothetical protein